MTEHEICRLNLKSAIAEMQKSHPRRRVSAEVTGDCVIARDHHYWVKVSDTLPPLGSKPNIGGPGHARFVEYEMVACCRWAARCAALDQHDRKFPTLTPPEVKEPEVRLVSVRRLRVTKSGRIHRADLKRED